MARSVQFAPFIVRDYCREHRLPFSIRLPDASERPATEVDDATLVALRPEDSLGLLRALARSRQAATGRPAEVVVEELNRYVETNRFNVARQGIGAVLAATRRRPVVLASAAAHYTIAKACNVTRRVRGRGGGNRGHDRRGRGRSDSPDSGDPAAPGAQ
jgi:hypothetical protein